MEAFQKYKSFNGNKSIEELQYNISIAINRLENLKLELEFYTILIHKPFFKNHMINLYESLSIFKKELKAISDNRVALLNKMYSHSNYIRNKIECDDLACDYFFIKEHDDIELRVFNFHEAFLDLKFRLFQYLESVFVN